MKMKTNNPGWGGKRQGAGRPKQYIHKKIPLRHGAGIEFTEHYYLSPEYPNDPTHIVLAQNDDEGYGVYIDEVWFGASQALRMLEYLQEHKAWLEEKA